MLFVGRIDPIKGIDTLLAAFRQVATGIENVILAIVGGDLDTDGDRSVRCEQVETEVARLGLVEQVRFMVPASKPSTGVLHRGRRGECAVPIRIVRARCR